MLQTLKRCGKLTHKITAVKNGFNNSCHESSTVEAGLPTYPYTQTEHNVGL